MPHPDMMKKTYIDLDPPYQRGQQITFSSPFGVINQSNTEFVWSEEKQVALIDSIITNVAIPQIIFSKRNGSVAIVVCV